jgi:hypothetical protein
VTQPWTVESLAAALPKVVKPVAEWKVTASDELELAQKGCDGDMKTRWETKANQKKGMWYQVELPEAKTVSGLRLDDSARPSASPKSYKVEGSVDGKKWIALGSTRGLPGLSETYFAKETPVKFLKVTIADAQNNQPWAIQEFQLLGR